MKTITGGTHEGNRPPRRFGMSDARDMVRIFGFVATGPVGGAVVVTSVPF